MLWNVRLDAKKPIFHPYGMGLFEFLLFLPIFYPYGKISVRQIVLPISSEIIIKHIGTSKFHTGFPMFFYVYVFYVFQFSETQRA
jgi:hypothetical protein